MLHALFRMGHYDHEMLTIAASMIQENKFTNLSQLTTVLYMLAKFGYRSQTDSYLDSAITIFEKEPKLDAKLAIRNLWNLFALDYKSEQGLEAFANVLVRVGNAYQFSEIDIANIVRTFAHFEYKNHDCLDLMLRKTIKQANDMDIKSLATIVASLADLDKADPVLMSITREIILKNSDFVTLSQ